MTHPITERKGCGDSLWMWFYVLVSLSIFWQSRESTLPATWMASFEDFKNIGWANFINTPTDSALLPLKQVFYFVFIKIFGKNTPTWVTVAATLHGINAWMVYNLVRRLLTIEGGKAEVFPPLAAAVLFLVSPFHAEVVLGRVTFHYLLGGYFLMKTLHRTLDFVETEEKVPLQLINFWLFLAVLTVPWAALVPMLAALVFLGFYAIRNQMAVGQRLAAQFLVPQLMLVLAIFFVNQSFFKNVWEQYSFSNLSEIWLKLVLQLTFFASFWKENLQNAVQHMFESATTSTIVWSVLVSLGVLFFQRFNRLNIQKQWAGLAMLAIFVALLPFVAKANFIGKAILQDRYFYPASIFSAIFISLIISGLRSLYPLMALAVVLISVQLLIRNQTNWQPKRWQSDLPATPAFEPPSEGSPVPDTLKVPPPDSTIQSPN